jgi:hypothetical protein
MPRGGSQSILALATLLVACRGEGTAPPVQVGPVPSPAEGDRGMLCLDVAGVRACWGDGTDDESCRSATCLVPRPLPSVPAPPSGFRCTGQRSQRSCVTRAWQGAPFTCNQNRCVQSPLRMPDNGEWECVEMAGAVICRFLAEAAGIARGPLEAGFVCGNRAGHGELVCVDFSPDPPPLPLGSWSCRVTYDSGSATRACTAAKEPKLGDRCTSNGDCPAGASCVSGRCLPDQPKPGCWFDQDCGQSAQCRYGSCRAKE